MYIVHLIFIEFYVVHLIIPKECYTLFIGDSITLFGDFKLFSYA